jgi:hypothetical protein
MATLLVWITLASLAGEYMFRIGLTLLSSSRFCIVGMEVSLFRQSEDASIRELQQHLVSSQRLWTLSPEIL